MAAIRGRDTQPELKLRRALHRLGFRFVLSPRDLPGRPDVVLPRYRVAIFVHGCFWHRHPGCRFTATPSTRVEFWNAKFAANVRRDWRNIEDLRRAGWRVLVVWECSLRKRAADDQLISELLSSWIQSGSQQAQITTT